MLDFTHAFELVRTTDEEYFIPDEEEDVTDAETPDDGGTEDEGINSDNGV